MEHSDIEHMAQGYPPEHIAKDSEEVIVWLATQLLATKEQRDMHRNSEVSWEKAMMAAIGEDGTGSVAKAIAELKAQRDALAAENAAMKSAISYVCDTDNLPEYQYDGMGCGIEDRGITDRYEAARYGWDEAMERIYSEVMPCAADIETPATDAYLNSVRADALASFAHQQRVIADATPDAAFQRHRRFAAGLAEDFAAQLRAGEPS